MYVHQRQWGIRYGQRLTGIIPADKTTSQRRFDVMMMPQLHHAFAAHAGQAAMNGGLMRLLEISNCFQTWQWLAQPKEKDCRTVLGVEVVEASHLDYFLVSTLGSQMEWTVSKSVIWADYTVQETRFLHML